MSIRHDQLEKLNPILAEVESQISVWPLSNTSVRPTLIELVMPDRVLDDEERAFRMEYLQIFATSMGCKVVPLTGGEA